MDSPALEWTLTATLTRLLGVLNMISAALPVVTWRCGPGPGQGTPGEREPGGEQGLVVAAQHRHMRAACGRRRSR
jgi:hypothetical protein